MNNTANNNPSPQRLLLLVGKRGPQRQTSGFAAAQQQQTPDTHTQHRAPCSAPPAPSAARPRLWASGPRRTTIRPIDAPSPGRALSNDASARCRGDRAQPPPLLVASANRTVDTGNSFFCNVCCFQPYFAFPRSMRLGVFIETPDTGNNLRPWRAPRWPAWLTESINFYAQINFDMLTDDIDMGGDAGLTYYLTRAFAFNIYSGLSEGRSTYVGIGIAFDWRNLFRMGVFL